MSDWYGALPVLARVAADEAESKNVGPGIVAFLIVAALAVATFLLIRSMLHHLRKVPPSFETTDHPEAQGGQTDDKDSDSDS